VFDILPQKKIGKIRTNIILSDPLEGMHVNLYNRKEIWNFTNIILSDPLEGMHVNLYNCKEIWNFTFFYLHSPALSSVIVALMSYLLAPCDVLFLAHWNFIGYF
jgi:hypothetical protein